MYKLNRLTRIDDSYESKEILKYLQDNKLVASEMNRWSNAEEIKLFEALMLYGRDFEKIVACLNTKRSVKAVQLKIRKLEKVFLKDD